MIENYKNLNKIKNVACSLINQYKLNDSFYIVSMKHLDYKIKNWFNYLPKIKPYYAVKCNPNEKIIKQMVNKGLGFDCASLSEISRVKKLGGNDIIFAHPFKKIGDLIYATNNNVKYTTFDSLCEINKINKYSPDINCLIRLKIDNVNAKVQLGLKYGVEENEYKKLINECRRLNIKLVGIAFHVGSDNNDPYIFKNAFDYCNRVIEYADTKNYNLNLIDIGGGFSNKNFVQTSIVIKDELNKLDKIYRTKNIKYISEPGRYFAEELFTFFTPIVGIKEKNNKYYYWITDSLYGSFNCIMYDNQIPSFDIVRNPFLKETYSNKQYDSIVYGLSCDSIDVINNDTKLPMLRVGDFLMVNNFGAYTISGSCDFNGLPMSNPKMFYI
jgi:ornithine decarboxylase